MINNNTNVTALNTNYLATPIANLKADLKQVITETHNLLVDIIDIIANDLQCAIDEIMKDKEAPEQMKQIVKTQIGAVLAALNEQKAALQNDDRSDWSTDPKELLKLLTDLGSYLEKSAERAKEQNDAFKVHSLEQKAEQVSNLKSQLEALA